MQLGLCTKQTRHNVAVLAKRITLLYHIIESNNEEVIKQKRL